MRAGQVWVGTNSSNELCFRKEAVIIRTTPDFTYFRILGEQDRGWNHSTRGFDSRWRIVRTNLNSTEDRHKRDKREMEERKLAQEKRVKEDREESIRRSQPRLTRYQPELETTMMSRAVIGTLADGIELDMEQSFKPKPTSLREELQQETDERLKDVRL